MDQDGRRHRQPGSSTDSASRGQEASGSGQGRLRGFAAERRERHALGNTTQGRSADSYLMPEDDMHNNLYKKDNHRLCQRGAPLGHGSRPPSATEAGPDNPPDQPGGAAAAIWGVMSRRQRREQIS